jgi:hypothetical protein
VAETDQINLNKEVNKGEEIVQVETNKEAIAQDNKEEIVLVEIVREQGGAIINMHHKPPNKKKLIKKRFKIKSKKPKQNYLARVEEVNH